MKPPLEIMATVCLVGAVGLAKNDWYDKGARGGVGGEIILTVICMKNGDYMVQTPPTKHVILCEQPLTSLI